MKKKDSLSRLHEIRQKREEKSREVLIAKEGERRRANAELDRAAHHVKDHVASARDQEQQMIGAMIGKVFRPNALLNVQTSLDTLKERQKELAEIETQARQLLQQKSDEVRNARQQYQQHQRKSAKLFHVLETHGKRLLRRQLAVMEAGEDDQNGDRRAQNRPAANSGSTRNDNA